MVKTKVVWKNVNWRRSEAKGQTQKKYPCLRQQNLSFI